MSYLLKVHDLHHKIQERGMKEMLSEYLTPTKRRTKYGKGRAKMAENMLTRRKNK